MTEQASNTQAMPIASIRYLRLQVYDALPTQTIPPLQSGLFIARLEMLSLIMISKHTHTTMEPILMLLAQ